MPSANTSAKSSRSPRKARPKPGAVSPEQRHRMIEEAAYFRAEQRDFYGGDPVADWLLSEQEVDDVLSQGMAR